MVSSCFMLTVNDALTKWLTPDLAATDILLCQSFLFLAGLFAALPWIGAARLFHVVSWKKQAMRAAFNLGTNILFVLALKGLPLSTAVTLAFASPLIMMALSPWLLGEALDTGRLASILIGFAGVVLIAQPSLAEFSYVAVLPLLAALCSALREIVTRQPPFESSGSLMFYSILVIFVATLASTDGSFPRLDARLGMLLVLSSAAQLGAVYLLVESLRHAEAMTIGIYKYSSLVFATAFDLILFRRMPTLDVLVGGALIIGAMIFFLRRSRLRATVSEQRLD
jgi:drug/metabolite transporter (DMT)-like permease